MNRRKSIIIFITFWPFIMYGQQNDSSSVSAFALKGYFKDLQMLIENPVNNQFLYANQIHNRTALSYYYRNYLTCRIELRNRLFTGSLINEVPGIEKFIGSDNGITDLSYTSALGNYSLVDFMIDRAWIGFRKSNWDISVGRQRINWGLNMVWNPNDLFNAYNYFDFDYEERPGSDAVRVQYFTSGFSYFEAAVSKGKNQDDLIYALLYRFNKVGYDFQLLGGSTNSRITLGGGWAGNIGEAGFKGEFTWFDKSDDQSSNFTFSPGIEITLSKGWYLNGSYLYNKNGGSDQGLSGLSSLSASQNAFPYEHAGIILVSKEINPIINTSFSILYSNNKDFSILPGITYAFLTNWDLLLNGQFFGSTVDAADINTGLFLRLKWSFARGG